jgi:uncharacterized protein
VSSTTTADTTGAPTTVAHEPGRFTIAVEGRTVGLADYVDRGGRRIFPHTEVDPTYRGRGLATILVAEALRATTAEGLRIVPSCSMVARFVEEHAEYADVTDWS